MRAYLALLKVPPVRRLLLASVPADFADWLDYVGIVALLVYTWNQGPFVLALFAVALAAPYIAVGPLAGALDRGDLRFLLVASNLGRALMTLALIFAPNAAVVLVIVFLRASIDSAFTPARQAALQAVTAPEQLTAANGAVQAINQITKIVGPALGGLLLALMPLTALFALNAALSLVAAVTVLGIGLPRREKPVEAPRPLFADIPEGWREFRRNRQLAAGLAFVGGAFFCIFLYDTLIALLIDNMGYDRTIFGISVGCSGAGGLIAAFLAGSRDTARPLRVMAATTLVSGPVTIALAAAALIGITVPEALLYLSMALMGGSTVFMLVPYRTLVQRAVAPERIGRVFATGEAVTMTVMLTAPFLGSFVAGAFGVPVAFLAGGALLAALGIVGFIAGNR